MASRVFGEETTHTLCTKVRIGQSAQAVTCLRPMVEGIAFNSINYLRGIAFHNGPISGNKYTIFYSVLFS